MKYLVIIGSTVKESGSWNTNGMQQNDEREFCTLEEAREWFDSIDVRDIFITEWLSSGVKPRNKGAYAELATIERGEVWEDFVSLDFKEYNADDYEAEQAAL